MSEELKNAYIETERIEAENLQEILNKLEDKWFKTSSIKQDIILLRKVVELKLKLVEDLTKWEKKNLNKL